MSKENKSELEIKYTNSAEKPNDLIIRELLSNILQALLKSQGYTQDQIDLLLEKIYNY